MINRKEIIENIIVKEMSDMKIMERVNRINESRSRRRRTETNTPASEVRYDRRRDEVDPEIPVTVPLTGERRGVSPKMLEGKNRGEITDMEAKLTKRGITWNPDAVPTSTKGRHAFFKNLSSIEGRPSSDSDSEVGAAPKKVKKEKVTKIKHKKPIPKYTKKGIDVTNPVKRAKVAVALAGRRREEQALDNIAAEVANDRKARILAHKITGNPKGLGTYRSFTNKDLDNLAAKSGTNSILQSAIARMKKIMGG